jgi:hypothetical protein
MESVGCPRTWARSNTEAWRPRVKKPSSRTRLTSTSSGRVAGLGRMTRTRSWVPSGSPPDGSATDGGAITSNLEHEEWSRDQRGRDARLLRQSLSVDHERRISASWTNWSGQTHRYADRRSVAEQESRNVAEPTLGSRATRMSQARVSNARQTAKADLRQRLWARAAVRIVMLAVVRCRRRALGRARLARRSRG